MSCPRLVEQCAPILTSAAPLRGDIRWQQEGQLFRVKIRRQEKRSSADLSGMSPRSQQTQQPPVPPGGGSAGAGPAEVERGVGGKGPPSPPASARLADDDSDMGRADLSIEARLRAHARGAVNAAAMARKLMTSSGTLKSSIIAPSRQGDRPTGHHSLPATAGGALRDEMGRRVHSEGYTQAGAKAPTAGGGWDNKQPVSAAERMQIARDLAAQQREIRLRMRALHAPSDTGGKRKDQDGSGDGEWQVNLQPLYPEKSAQQRSPSPAGEQLAANREGAGTEGDRDNAGDKSNQGVLSAKELQELDRARILKRLITSRTSRLV